MPGNHQLNQTQPRDNAQPRLLIVEDDAVQQTLLARAAASAGLDSVLAGSFEQAQARFECEKFDCITLDLSLADGDGFSLMEQLAAGNYQGPLIVISGAGTVNRRISRRLAKALGINLLQSFPKPVDLAALRLALRLVRESIDERRIA